MTNLILTAALKGTIVLGAAWIATLLLRQRSADLRHRIWLAALLAMALLLIPVPVPQTLRMTIDATATAPGTAAVAARSIPSLAIVWSVIAALLLLGAVTGVPAAVDVALTVALLATFASIAFVKKGSAILGESPEPKEGG